ncbi:bromodomain adjacent to zinc finger domain protein 2B-like [Ctenocephalides felis]|uniref:bromodomain adjacent to zinc finger domain protein 2B-like n=1 Tax=Ctenocephalides felis TaxID=7515 RepID=UPI000E6E4E7A|nr:bromodomain adjacent to zinc finger domain protein 2B-like [Ctenocephalides felis]
MEKKNSERERKKTTSEIDKTQKKLLDSKTSIKKTSTGTSKTQLFDSSTNNVDKTSINKKSTSQKEKTTTDLQKKEKVSKSIIQNGSKTRLDKDKDKDVSKTKVEGKKIDTSKIKNVQADKKYAKVPINSKENSFVDQVPYNATKTKLVKPKVDDKTGLDKKKRIVADKLKNGDAKVSSSKKKDRVMATHTNVTVQSPVHSKQNSLVEDLSQNYNEVSSMYKSTPEAFGDNIKVSSKTKSRPEDLGDNIKVSSKTKSIPEAFGDNIKVSSKSKSSSDNTEVPSSSKPTPESLRTNTEESSIFAPKKLKREKTLILETNEIKILKNISYTIDLDNPDAEISLTNYPNDDENYDYEDDFESYESDFESCSSSSPENQEEDITGTDQEEDNENLSSNNNLDSSKDNASNKDGTFKDSGASKVFTQDEERKLDSGNFDLPSKPTLSSPPTLTDINETDNVVDEGFAEQSNPKSDLLTEESSLGDDIVVHYVEMQPLTYKEFMDNSLHQESLQIQENQDMNIDDLYPIPRYITETDNALNRDFPVDFPKLNTFLRKAAKEVLSCLEEQLQPKLKHNKENLDFSEGYYKMHQDLFKGIPASCLCFQNNNKFLAAAFNEVNLKNERRNALDLGSGDDIDIR